MFLCIYSVNMAHKGPRARHHKKYKNDWDQYFLQGTHNLIALEFAWHLHFQEARSHSSLIVIPGSFHLSGISFQGRFCSSWQSPISSSWWESYLILMCFPAVTQGTGQSAFPWTLNTKRVEQLTALDEEFMDAPGRPSITCSSTLNKRLLLVSGTD
jgi:hypothetical protein